MGQCALCHEQPDDSELLDHLRVMHPSDYGDGPKLWPDGKVVVVEQTDYSADEIGGAL